MIGLISRLGGRHPHREINGKLTRINCVGIGWLITAWLHERGEAGRGRRGWNRCFHYKFSSISSTAGSNAFSLASNADRWRSQGYLNATFIGDFKANWLAVEASADATWMLLSNQLQLSRELPGDRWQHQRYFIRRYFGPTLKCVLLANKLPIDGAVTQLRNGFLLFFFIKICKTAGRGRRLLIN